MIKLLLLAVLVLSCGYDEARREAPAPDYTKAPSADYAVGRGRKEAPAVRFFDITAAAGIDFSHENGARGDKATDIELSRFAVALAPAI